MNILKYTLFYANKERRVVGGIRTSGSGLIAPVGKNWSAHVEHISSPGDVLDTRV